LSADQVAKNNDIYNNSMIGQELKPMKEKNNVPLACGV